MGLITILLTAFLVIGLRRSVGGTDMSRAKTALVVLLPVSAAMFVLLIQWEGSG